MQKIRDFFTELKLLLRSIPSMSMSLFVISVILMNLMANKSATMPVSWLALDCGILLSWFAGLLMDMVVPRFGPRAATYLSIVAMLVNLFFAFILYILGVIPGTWSQSYVPGSEEILNQALDATFAGTWYVLLGSSIAFVVSAIVNNTTNYAIGRLMHGRKSFKIFALRSYISTFVGQFIDNLVFALLVSYFFFGWTILQCFTCAATGAVAELICEAIFSPIGYRVSRIWEKEGVGREYIEYIQKKYGKEQVA